MEVLDESRAIAQLTERLTDRFPRIPDEDIDRVVSVAQESLDGKPIRTFVPLLIENDALGQLRSMDRQISGSKEGVAAQTGSVGDSTDARPKDRGLANGPLLDGRVEGYMASSVPICASTDLVRDVRSSLIGQHFDCSEDVAVCEGDAARRRLVGVVPVERLLAAGDDEEIHTIMQPDPGVVAPGLDDEKAAWKAVERGEATLAVVDREGHFQGLVPPSRLRGAVLRHYDDDFARLGGYLRSSASARNALSEPVRDRLWHVLRGSLSDFSDLRWRRGWSADTNRR